MKLIVGLGNPGKNYSKTRHNVGWIVLDKLKDVLDPSATWQNDAKFEADICAIEAEEKLLLVKPQTYMNNSGRSVRRLADFYKIPHEDIIVIHDELDIDFGSVRVRFGGSAAGHNGVGSIIHHLGSENFWRVRIGINSKDGIGAQEGKDFVLTNFSKTEAEDLLKIIDSVVDFLVNSLKQNKFEDITFSGR